MDYNDYFDPVKIDCSKFQPSSSNIYNSCYIHNEDAKLSSVSKFDLAIIGIPEDRNSDNKGCALAPDLIRSKLYPLHRSSNLSIIDLGNLKIGKNINDTYFAVRDVIAELLKTETIPILIGGSQDITYANYLTYSFLKKDAFITAIDSRLDLGDADTNFDSKSYLSKIILDNSEFLFNFTNIGYQSYFVDKKETDLMDKLYFDTFRLGNIRSEIIETEPILRNSDIVSIDIGAVKQSDAPGNSNPSPNGIFADDICQIARYAGLSNKVTSFGIYEINPEFDRSEQTVHLGAQIIWSFIDGFYQRINDNPYNPIK